MPTPSWRGRRAQTCTCTERFGFSHTGRHARRSACGCSRNSYAAGSPRTRRFSRDCPYRATDARQVAGNACRNPVGGSFQHRRARLHRFRLDMKLDEDGMPAEDATATHPASAQSESRRLPPLCVCVSDAPSARERGAWLQADQGFPGSKCVWRASHGLDGEAATRNVRKPVAAEEHQARVTTVDPKGELSFAT